ncbi:hypothetical protein [Bartonella harrusi]|uniref:hypothetical protein n=1 Tax=Bartonella harrusi TaxID=2961895 RepID=UPI0020C84602|nr:hypothetical protein [Bartonella harrusi]
MVCVIMVVLSFTILAWLRGGVEEKIIPLFIIGFGLIIWLFLLDQKTRSMSDKIWQNIQQTSEDISEKETSKTWTSTN